LRRTTSFDVLSVKIHAGVSALGEWKNQKKVVDMRQRSVANIWVYMYISRMWGEETLNGLTPIFFLVGGIHGVITHAGFGDDRLRGSWVVSTLTPNHWFSVKV